MMTNPVFIYTIGIVFVVSCYGNSSVKAQEIFQSSEVIPYDIFEKNVGPVTTELNMAGYTDTDEYHTVRHVSVNKGSDALGDGSLTNPWASIRHALNQIEDARISNRYALLIAAGEYAEGTIQMKEFVHLYGGFDPSIWHRDIQSYKTILNGENRNRIMKCADQAKIDGFVIQDGVMQGKGGAILCDGTSPVISNNIFFNNKTLTPKSWDPEFIHEIANDGGAVAALNGASPRILNNLFVDNQTQTGRGAGIAAYNRAAPLIAYNIFLNNTAGTDDPMRSSDGGAISSSNYSPADIYYNVILGNRAENKNDGGGIFTEKWSSLHIIGNLLVGNFSSDDGGGIYLSGQVHHYITEPEPVVPEDRYLNKVNGNYLIGNSIDSDAPPGALRFTNDTRVEFESNISFSNDGGLDFRKSMVRAKNNIMIDIVTIRESDYTAYLYDNIILGNLITETEIEEINTQVIESGQTADDIILKEIFVDDGLLLSVQKAVYEKDKFVTVFNLKETISETGLLKNRVVKIDDAWSVIWSNNRHSITVWGDHSNGRKIEVLATFRINRDSDYTKENTGINGH